MAALRLGVLAVFAEEGWPSMDLFAEMLLAKAAELPDVAVADLRPRYRRRCENLPAIGKKRAARNADRLANRFWDYPRHAAALARRGAADVWHVADHSYAQLIHSVPAARAGALCQDLDTFRCLLEPTRDPRPGWFRAMTRRVLAGLQKAAAVFHTTQAVRAEIVRFGLIDESRLVQAKPGVAAEFVPPAPGAPRPPGLDAPYLLHVGSCIPRKRIDLLLEVFAEVRRRRPELRLVQAGGTFTQAQRDQAERLGLGTSVEQRRGLSRVELSALYGHAALVLQPSDAEGFGMPAVEALACGSALVASDLPVLREAAGGLAAFCPPGQLGPWATQVAALLDDPAAAPPLPDRIAHAAQFTWEAHARTIVETYRRLAN